MDRKFWKEVGEWTNIVFALTFLALLILAFLWWFAQFN